MGGDASGLESALKDVNKSLNATKRSLRDVDRLLKLDPGNTELLEQKQRLLSEAIEDTEKKLESLRQASDKAKAALESGDLGQDQYDALQREIIATENNLEGLKSQAKETEAALKGTGGGLKSMGEAAGNAGDKLSGLSKGAGTLIGATAALLPVTEELNRDLSFLEQNAKEANVGVGAMEEAFKTFNAVSGETDSSVEAVSNLLQAGFTESNLQVAVEGVSGAMARFPDTLKIESLADSIQETVATGKSIGQFGEYLDRVGIGAANFDAELANCSTEAERADLVLQALADGGAQDTYDAWEKGNKGLKEYSDATVDMQMALGDLAKEIAPLAADIINFAKEGVEAFNSLPKPIKAVTGGIVGLTAVTSPALKAFSNITNVLPKFTANTKTATAATKAATAGTKLLNASLLTNPYLLAAGAATALGVAIYKVVQAQDAETKAAERAAEKREERVEAAKNEYESAEVYLEKLKELESVENKTTAQKEQMKAMVDQLNESVKGLNLTYDEETDKLNQTTDAIERKIEASKDAAVTEVYDENAQKALEDYARTIVKLEDAEAKLEEQEKKLNKIGPENKAQYKSMSQQIGATKEKIDDLKNASSEYYQEAVKNRNLAAMQSGQWDSLVDDAETAGLKIPKGLVKGIKAGEYEIPTTVSELQELINFQNVVNKADKAGIDIPKKISNGLTNGTLSVSEATTQLTDVVNGELAKTANKAGGKGTETSNKYASAISAGAGAARTAGQTLGNAANSGAGSVSAYSTGVDFSNGLAQGIRAGAYAVRAAAESVAAQALAAAKREAQTGSPSKKWDRELGQMDAAGLARGLLKGIPKVEAAGAALSEAEFVGANGTIGVQPFNSAAISQSLVQTFDYGQIYSAMKAAQREATFSIVLDGRELGRGLRGMGVQFT